MFYSTSMEVVHLLQVSATLTHWCLSLSNQVQQFEDCPPLNLSVTWVSRERQPAGPGLEFIDKWNHYLGDGFHKQNVTTRTLQLFPYTVTNIILQSYSF